MFQSVKVKNLSLSKDNVRKSNRDTDLESLAANIAAQGLLQNLIVTPLKKAGHFTVKAGGRRLRALQMLIAQGTLPGDHEVQAMVLTDEERSVEASLSENYQRVPMNPADECTAFNLFIQKGASAEDVAKRFGVTTRFVEQRVRLAELAPPIFEALAAGQITLGVAQAYAVTADTDRQAHVFAQMQASYYGDNAENIKRAILNGSTKASDARARYVGREAYIAAGGAISRDLFSSEEEETWQDSHIIEQLAQQKLEAAAADLAQAQGFGFVMPVIATRVPYDLERQYHEFHPTPREMTPDEQARYDGLIAENDTLVGQLEDDPFHGTPEADAAQDRIEAIDGELDALSDGCLTVDPALMPQLGTFVYIGPDGDTRVHTRYFSEKPVVDPHAPVREGPTGAGDHDGDGDDARAPESSLSARLIDELATQRRQILVAHLASDPGLALDLTIFLMAQKVVSPLVALSGHTTLRAEEASYPIGNFHDEASLASQTIGEQRQALDQSWAGYPTMSARFDAFRQLDDEARAAWVGFAMARTLEATLNVPSGYRAHGFHDHLGRLLDIQVEHWWRPNAENFFGRVKKDIMLEALEEIGGPTLRARYKDAKKGDLASACAALCDGKGIVEAEIREKAVAWLPDVMRFEGQEKPDLRIAAIGDPAVEDESDEGADDDRDDEIGDEEDVDPDLTVSTSDEQNPPIDQAA